MYLPKTDIHNALSSIPNVTVRQAAQKTQSVIPSITFSVADNALELDLNNEISKQALLVNVDIWAENSTKADALLAQAETKMREIGYRLDFMMDIQDPENICHISTRFAGVK